MNDSARGQPVYDIDIDRIEGVDGSDAQESTAARSARSFTEVAREDSSMRYGADAPNRMDEVPSLQLPAIEALER